MTADPFAKLRAEILAIYEAYEPTRHANEVAYWLDQGFTTREKVNKLMKEIEKHRGREAAEKLREGMREEFARRRARAR